jgi:hypothetical protein
VAVDSAIEERLAAAARLRRPELDIDCFLAAMLNPLGGQAACAPDPDVSPSKLIFDLAPPSHSSRFKTLSDVVNRT